MFRMLCRALQPPPRRPASSSSAPPAGAPSWWSTELARSESHPPLHRTLLGHSPFILEQFVARMTQSRAFSIPMPLAKPWGACTSGTPTSV